MSSQNRIGLILVAVVVVSIGVLVLNRDTQASGENGLGDVSVSCAPAQRAVVQRTGVGPSAQVNILCLDAVGTQPVAYASREAEQRAPALHTNPAGAVVPAVMYAQVPVAQAVPAAQPPGSASGPARRVERNPSLQKRLLIIGGTSGAGAGIGALVGGKKGALIGAAIGGGGAAIVDQLKHR